MNFVNLTCPGCGAQLSVDSSKEFVFCQFCGKKLLINDVQKVQTVNAEQTGYDFERGRQRAQAQSQPIPQQPQPPQKKRMTWLWVLGWIFIFPVPLTIILFRNKKMKQWLKILLIILAWFIYSLFLLTAACSNSSGSETGTSRVKPTAAVEETTVEETTVAPTTEKPTEASTEAPTEAPTKKPDEKPTKNASELISVEYRNALRSAQNYIAFTAFSKEGLYDQLIFNKYSPDAARYAVETVICDWKQNAVESAKNYLEFTPMSRDELYEQLIYAKYTEEEAQYAVDQVY